MSQLINKLISNFFLKLANNQCDTDNSSASDSFRIREFNENPYDFSEYNSSDIESAARKIGVDNRVEYLPDEDKNLLMQELIKNKKEKLEREEWYSRHENQEEIARNAREIIRRMQAQHKLEGGEGGKEGGTNNVPSTPSTPVATTTPNTSGAHNIDDGSAAREKMVAEVQKVLDEANAMLDEDSKAFENRLQKQKAQFENEIKNENDKDKRPPRPSLRR